MTVLAAIAYLVAIAGLIVPVLPGTALIVIATLIWAIVIGGPAAWFTFGIVLLFSIIGMATSYILTGTRLKGAAVPNWPIVVAVIAAVVGFFVIPVLGLPIGFMLGLYGSELYRQKDARKALDTSIIALKALGLGLLIELGMAFLSLIAFTVGNIVHFTQL